jgi:hypothetical protein
MKMFDAQTGKAVDVPDEHVQTAFQSGKYGLAPGSTIPIVRRDGQMGTIQSQDFSQELNSGSRIATPQEFHQAELEARRGGIGNTLAAAGEGLARGLTLGASDPLAVEGARVFGGDKAAEKVRTHLAEEKSVHNIAAGASELVGAAAPILASGGTAAAAEGAGALARGAGLAREAVGAAGILPRAVAGAGSIAEHAAASVLGGTAESAVGRIAQAAIKKAAGGAAEGALFAEGNEISESTLGDHELTAEKLLAAMGHGALVGGALGGALGGLGKAAGEGVSAGARKLAPALEKAAGEQMAQAIGLSGKLAREAEARAGGSAAVGRTVLRETGLGAEALTKAGQTAEELAPKITAARARIGQQVGDIMEKSAATVDAREVLEPIETLIARHARNAAGQDAARALSTYRDALAEKLGLVEKVSNEVAPDMAGLEAKSAAEAHAMFQRQVREAESTLTGLKKQLRLANELGDVEGRQNLLPQIEKQQRDLYELRAAGPSTPSPVKPPAMPPNMGKAISLDKRIPVQALIEQRQGLGEAAFGRASSLEATSGKVEGLRDIYRHLTDVEERAIDRTARQMGGPGGEELRSLKKTYQQLSIAEKSATASAQRAATAPALGLTDRLASGMGFVTAGPLGAAKSLALSKATDFVRERGNSLAAVMLERGAQFGFIQKAQAAVDKDMNQAVSGFFAKERPRVRLRTFGSEHDVAPTRERYEERVQHVAAMAAGPGIHAEQVSRHLGGMGTHAPQTTQALATTAQKATSFLQSKIPPGRTDMQSLQPGLQKQRISDVEMHTFLKYADAVDNPMSVVRDLESHRISPEAVEALKAVYPKLYDELGNRVMKQVNEQRSQLPYDKIVQLGILFGRPTDATLAPDFIRDAQGTFAGHQGQPATPGGSTPHSSTSRPLAGSAKESTLGMQSAEIGP